MDAAFLTTRLDRPSHRFRSEQFFGSFEAAGHRCEAIVVPRSKLARWRMLRNLARFDIVCVQQRLFSSIELSLLRRFARTLVYDVDDAVMFGAGGRRDRRRESRFSRMLDACDHVVCGNAFLRKQVDGRTPSSLIVTAVDTNRFHPRARHRTGLKTVIGWTGSRSTNQYLNDLLPAIARVRRNIKLKIISDTLDGLELETLGEIPWQFVPWSPGGEVTETAEFEIGLMPLPDNEWTRGKCGCKALQYMSLAMPNVCSPVGVNREIVEHGRTGYLAASHEQWRHSLIELVDDEPLRIQMGVAGRQRVEAYYSVETVGHQLVTLFERLVNEGGARCAVSAAS